MHRGYCGQRVLISDVVRCTVARRQSAALWTKMTTGERTLEQPVLVAAVEFGGVSADRLAHSRTDTAVLVGHRNEDV